MPSVEEVSKEERLKNQRNRGKKRREKKKPRRESCQVRAHMFLFSHGFTFFTIDFWDLSVNACKSVVVFVYYQLFFWFASPIKRYYTSVFGLSCVSPLFLFSGSYVLWKIWKWFWCCSICVQWFMPQGACFPWSCRYCL